MAKINAFRVKCETSYIGIWINTSANCMINGERRFPLGIP